MTKGRDCLILCVTSIVFTKYSCFLLFSVQFSCPTNQPKDLGYTYKQLYAPSTHPLPLYTYCPYPTS